MRPVDASLGDAGLPDAPTAPCGLRLAGWNSVDLFLGGDFERAVAASPLESGALWLVAGGRIRERAASQVLRIEVAQGLPRVARRVTLAGTEGWEPLAFADDGTTWALVARGLDGEPWIALFERDGQTRARTRIEALDVQQRYRMDADVALAQGDVVVAARRFGADRFVVERRDPTLGLRWSAPLPLSGYRLRPGGARLRAAARLYATDLTGLRALPEPAAPWGQMGATRTSWVGEGSDGFGVERDDGRATRGRAPGTSFATNGFLPTFESSLGVFVAVNVDFAPTLGWFRDDRLDWFSAPRNGGAVLPYSDGDAVGVFFLGVEIPRPEQPLRYWGCRR